MRLVARWGVAAAAAAAGFALAWCVCQEQIRLDEGISMGIAGAVLAILLAVAAWWAPRDADSAESDVGGHLLQKARAWRDVYMAGRDMTVNQRHRDK